MKTITSRDDFSKLDAKVEKDVEKYLAGTGLSCPIVKSVEQDDDLSCEMAVSYRFTFIYKDNEGGQLKEGYATYFANGTQMIQVEPDAHEITSEDPEWNVIYGDYGDALIYTLREDGFRKGKPVMVNDVMIRVEPANKSKTDIAPIVDKVVAALSI
jgi:hypothetical protein